MASKTSKRKASSGRRRSTPSATGESAERSAAPAKAMRATKAGAPAKAVKADASGRAGKATKGAKAAKAKRVRMPKALTWIMGRCGSIRSEMRRVTWPSKKELVSYSVAVCASLVVVGIFIALLDSAIGQGLLLFSGLRG